MKTQFLLQFFGFNHLKTDEQRRLSEKFHDLAHDLAITLHKGEAKLESDPTAPGQPVGGDS